MKVKVKPKEGALARRRRAEVLPGVFDFCSLCCVVQNFPMRREPGVVQTYQTGQGAGTSWDGTVLTSGRLRETEAGQAKVSKRERFQGVRVYEDELRSRRLARAIYRCNKPPPYKG
jgi:hypothetical protein